MLALSSKAASIISFIRYPSFKKQISAHDISLTRRGKSVLDKVSFELQQGEFLTIIGPNGAGKSSLIKVLLGLLVGL
jgi:ABC-type Mn2+/Zn2+ transport system ATPase subunit